MKVGKQKLNIMHPGVFLLTNKEIRRMSTQHSSNQIYCLRPQHVSTQGHHQLVLHVWNGTTELHVRYLTATVCNHWVSCYNTCMLCWHPSNPYSHGAFSYPVSCARQLQDLWGDCSSWADLISSNFSSVNTVCWHPGFWSNNRTVILMLLTRLWIVFLLGTKFPRNFLLNFLFLFQAELHFT
jgi:hypothetical protein